MNAYWKGFPEIDAELDEVKQFMLSSIEDAMPIIKDPITEIIEAGGKMLRPALVVLGAGFGKYNKDRIVPIAACVEFLHTATLIHDDVIDESKLRRGIESIQSKYSKDVAVLLGDYIFAKVFDILVGDYPAEMLKNLSKSILQICKGELSQYSNRYSDNIEFEQYIEIIAGKTAALFSMSLFSGAYEAEAKNSVIRHLSKLGYCMGMMFQITDDCLDYKHDTNTLGKSAVNDIKQGYITLPMFYALKKDDDNKLHKLVFESELSESNLQDIRKLVIELDGVKTAEEKAKEYRVDAYSALKKLKKSKEKKVLEYIISSMMDRSF
ncbi:MAG: polyprenyl synthetase family protein [Eubacteriales bacterium]